MSKTLEAVRISRTELLQALEAVQPGLSPRDILEQSSCFILKGGRVITFNDEVCCRTKTPLPEHFSGAVAGKALLEVVRRIPDEEVTCECRDGEFRISGKRRKAGIRMDPEVLLPFNTVERPSEWHDLEPEFCEALNTASECVGKDDSRFWSRCVRVTSEYVEACDNYQMVRCQAGGVPGGPFLLRGEAAKQVAAAGVSKVARTESYVHFRAQRGLILSCRIYTEDYPELGETLNMRGTPCKLPKALAESCELAGYFSAENPDDDQVTVDLKPGAVRVKGVGVSGWASEPFKMNYAGPEYSFRLSPKLLARVVDKYSECEIGDGRLRVDGGGWVYVTVLGNPAGGTEENGQPEEVGSDEG